MSDRSDLLGWLEHLYGKQCDGEWEHYHGFSIETLDNPGWLVQADLRATAARTAADRVLAVVGEPPSAENGNMGGSLWMVCEIKAGKFIGAGDPTQLRKILAELRSWLDADAGSIP